MEPVLVVILIVLVFVAFVIYGANNLVLKRLDTANGWLDTLYCFRHFNRKKLLVSDY